MNIRFQIILCVVLCGWSCAFAAPPPPQSIAVLNLKLAYDPDNPDNYFERGLLWIDEGQYVAGEDDFNRVLLLAPQHPEVRFWMGRLFQTSGRHERARQAYTIHLRQTPKDAAAHIWRGENYLKLKNVPAALDDFNRGLALSEQPEPWMYLRRAEIQRQIPDTKPEDIIEGLESGMKKLGPVVNLLKACLDIELTSSQPEKAQKRFATYARIAPFDALRDFGDLHAKAGDRDEAIRLYRSLLEKIETVPAHRRNNAHFSGLKKSTLEKISQLQPPDGASS